MEKKKRVKIIRKRKVVRKPVKKIVKKSDVTPSEPIIKTAIPMFPKTEVVKGNYCNVAVIQHTQREFVLDFMFAISRQISSEFGLPNQCSVVSRVITSPQHVKKIYEVLGHNIKQYEAKFGEIKN